jgi:hypothetical protein
MGRSVDAVRLEQRAFIAEATPAVLQVPLGQAFRMAISMVGKTDHIRIFALTSRIVSEHMQPREFPTLRLDLMLAGADSGTDSMLDNEVQLSVMYTWVRRVRAGAIGRLTVRQYNFYPTEWFVIFDNRLMITSTYVYDADLIGQTRTVPEAFVIQPYGHGAGLILTKMEMFDALFEAAVTDFGDGKYEGEYQLQDGMVRKCRKAGGEWEEVGAVSKASIA